MKNKHKISGDKKINEIMGGVSISIIFLIFLSAGYFALTIDSGPGISPAGSCHPDTGEDVTVTWTTDENSTSKVYYRLTGESSWTEESNDSETKQHSINIGLLANGTYQYYVGSCNAANCTNSSVESFIVYNKYAVEVSFVPSSIQGDPAETKSVSVKVKNTGCEDDDYNLTISNNECNADVSWTTESISVDSGVTGSKTLNVEIPTGYYYYDDCYFDVMAESVTGASDTKRITININQLYNVEVTSNDTEKSGIPGENVTYNLKVTNTGSSGDSFTLKTTGHLDNVYLSQNTTDTRTPGWEWDITLTVTIPPDASSGDQYETIVNATSQGDTSKNASITLTTIAKAGYGVELTPETQSSSADPGGSETYTITIKNTGNTADNFTLEFDNINGAAEVNLSKNNVTLNSGQQTTFTLTVTLPSSSAAGTVYRVNVTATSDSDTSVKDEAETITNTTSIAGGGITDFSAPENASLQDAIKFYITFNNTGSVDVNVTPKVTIPETGTVITGDTVFVQTQNTAVLEVEWTVTGLVSRIK